MARLFIDEFGLRIVLLFDAAGNAREWSIPCAPDAPLPHTLHVPIGVTPAGAFRTMGDAMPRKQRESEIDFELTSEWSWPPVYRQVKD